MTCEHNVSTWMPCGECGRAARPTAGDALEAARVEVERLHTENAELKARTCGFCDWYYGLPSVELTRPEFEGLLEYSTSTPTGTTIGKRWKGLVARHPERWVLREYVPHPDPGTVGIDTKRIVVRP